MREDKKELCSVCGEPMPPGEEMFNYHGFSGPCPKPPLPQKPTELDHLRRVNAQLAEALRAAERHIFDEAEKRDYTPAAPLRLMADIAYALNEHENAKQGGVG